MVVADKPLLNQEMISEFYDITQVIVAINFKEL